jgi:rhamnogalacturonan endolyase
MVHESNATGVDMHDARTGQVIWSLPSGGTDVGRGVIMDIDPRHPGAEAWASVGGLNNATGRQIGSTKPGSVNFAAWWDGDLLRELLNGNTIDKWDYNNNSNRRLLSAGTYNAASNNGTKSTPALSGDIFGDWREEIIWRNTNNTQLMIFTTTSMTNTKLRTLMHDIQYREAIAWQNTAYNQPPHPSFFIGDGMSTPPTPDLYFVGDNPNDSQPVSSSSSSSSAPNSSASSSSAGAIGVNLSGNAGNGLAALNWTVNGAVTGIEIYQDTDSNPTGRTRIAMLDVNARSYTVTGLTNSTPYWFWVKYLTVDGSGNSNAFSVTPMGGASSVAATSSSRSSTPASSVPSSTSSSVASSTPTSGSCSYVITNNWGNGFTGAIRITNSGSSPLNSWNVTWAYSGNTRLSGSWNATVSGSNPYSASNLSWNSVIQPGQTVEFGFQGTYSGSVETPTVNGTVCR